MRTALLLLAAIIIAQAADPAIRVDDAWSRATAPAAQAGAAFGRIVNTAGIDDALVAASSPVAETVELHTHIKDERGVMRMTAVERVPLPANQTTTMKPGGLHLMLMGLKQPLAEGSTFPLTCRFANATPITITVRVMTAGSMGPDQGGIPK